MNLYSEKYFCYNHNIPSGPLSGHQLKSVLYWERPGENDRKSCQLLLGANNHKSYWLRIK